MQDTTKESNEPAEDPQPETEKGADETKAERQEKTPDVGVKQEQQKKKDKKGKPGAKEQEEPAKKKIEHDENFNYIVRVANTDINGEHNVVQGLTQIKGIGRHMAAFVADTAGVDRTLKFGNLAEPQIVKLKEVLENIDEYAPAWMLNHRKDLYTGEDLHVISTDVASRLRDDINMMKMIRSYRGVRHELGLKVRGQRTSSNGRKGLALGVSKRKEIPAAASAKKEEPKEKK